MALKAGRVGVKPDAVDAYGNVINPNPTPYELPIASADTLGGVKIGDGISINQGVISADAQVPEYDETDADKILTVDEQGELIWDYSYSLPVASDSTLGGIKVGSGLKIVNGVLSLDLPVASGETLGGIKVGTGLEIVDGVLSVATPQS